MLVAAFCYRYEPEWLIEDLHTNLAWVDKIIGIDTSGYDELWIPRAERMRLMQDAGRKAGATWMLHLDPDERLETRAEKVIRRALERPHYVRYHMRMRELWTPHQYRVDGKWGSKRRRRLYRLGCRPDAPVGRLRLNIYHLATVEPTNRQMRARIHTDHNTWDNKSHGFEYLADETGLTLEDIPPGRGYHPPYREYLKTVPGYG